MDYYWLSEPSRVVECRSIDASAVQGTRREKMRRLFTLLNRKWFELGLRRCLSDEVYKNGNGKLAGRHSVASLADNAHQLNCDLYQLNRDGSLEIHCGPFDRAQICESYDLEPRDLQKIDTDLEINVPLIDVREGKFICFSFDKHRSLIQSDRSLFFVPSAEKVHRQSKGSRYSAQWQTLAELYYRNVQYIHRIYNDRLADPTSKHVLANPFEFQLTEINLDSIAHHLDLKTNELATEFDNVREHAYGRITVASLRELALLKERVDRHQRNGDLAHKAIVDVLAHDEDLIGMYLTDLRPRELSDHIQIELLLEASTKQMAEVCRPISDLCDSVRTLESTLGFMLDAVRNELLAFEIRINIITMSFGMGAFIAGIYGMNLSNGSEQHPHAFVVISGTCICLMAGTMAIAILKLIRYRKIRLRRTKK